MSLDGVRSSLPLRSAGLGIHARKRSAPWHSAKLVTKPAFGASHPKPGHTSCPTHPIPHQHSQTDEGTIWRTRQGTAPAQKCQVVPMHHTSHSGGPQTPIDHVNNHVQTPITCSRWAVEQKFREYDATYHNTYLSFEAWPP
jgi:hypothetical protein